jgi:hypothetical protein
MAEFDDLPVNVGLGKFLSDNLEEGVDRLDKSLKVRGLV